MRIDAPNERPVQRSRWVPLLVIGLALVVLAGTLAWSALDLRGRIQSQIVERDGEILDAVTIMQHRSDKESGETMASLDDPGEQLQLALKVSHMTHMTNVLGVRLYSADGAFVNALPANIADAALRASDLTPLRNLHPVSYFSAKAQMQEQDLLAETNGATEPLLVVEVPLRTDDDQHLAGVIQFLIYGKSIARQYADLDRNLALKFSAWFVVAAGILMSGLGLALRRVQRANKELAQRTNNLLQANRELALAARTSAVGAVASHLIHGLKNPLSGLRNFVHAHNAEKSNGSDTEWRIALSTTQRMEELINRVVRVLQEQQNGAEYEISIAELVGMLTPKAKALADSTGVRFGTRVQCDGTLSNREADLILLILENLVQNAIEATPPGKDVELSVKGDAGGIDFEVCDQGAGLPQSMRERLFMPCTSGKKGGGGIGLAISKQLAQSLGAKLELAQSGPAGCTFRLRLAGQAADTVEAGAGGRILAVEQPR
jgi:signal transduction histidine kinase